MAEYIDRETLLKQIGLAASRTALGETTLDKINSIEVIAIIKDMPTADVRPERHGHWIYQEPDDKFSWKPYLCSACGEKGGKNYTEFCPHCGAKMDGKDGENDG